MILFHVAVCVVVSALLTYRMAAIPSQKIVSKQMQRWRDSVWSLETKTMTEADGVPSMVGQTVKKQVQLPGRERSAWWLSMFECGECLGWWLALPSTVYVAVLGSVVTGDWRVMWIAGLFPAVAGLQQYMHRTDSNI